MKNSIFVEYFLLLSSVAGTMIIVISIISKLIEIQFEKVLAALI
jgi:Flp pilus assembly pilin Flp